MIIIKELSDDQDIGSQIVGTAVSTNVLDTGVADRNIGEGTQILCYASVGNELIGSATAATVQFALEHSDSEGSGYVDLLTIEPIAEALLIVGAEIFTGPIPSTTKRFIRAAYTVAGATLTSGFINCHLGTG